MKYELEKIIIKMKTYLVFVDCTPHSRYNIQQREIQISEQRTIKNVDAGR